MRWRPCSPDPMRRMRAAPTFACARRSSPWGRCFPSPASGPPAMQTRRLLRRASKPAAHGSETGRPPEAGSPSRAGWGCRTNFLDKPQETGPRMKPKPLLSRADLPCGFLFLCGWPPPFRLPAPPGDAMRLREPRPSPKKGKRSEPGQAAPAPRPLSIPRFFLSPSAPPESKPRGAHAGHGGQQPRAGQRRRACHAGHGRSLCAFHRVDNGKTGRLVPLDA